MRIDANDVHEGIGVKQHYCPISFLSFAYLFSSSVRRLDKHLANILPSKGFENFKWPPNDALPLKICIDWDIAYNVYYLKILIKNRKIKNIRSI